MKSFLIVSAILAVTIAVPPASAATKGAGRELAIKGCMSLTLSLRINDAFVKLPTAQQTEARKKKAISAEVSEMNEALKSFNAAAKVNSRWKIFATQIDTMLHTEKADDFTKAFSGIVKNCLALTPAAKASAKASAKATSTPTPKASATKK